MMMAQGTNQDKEDVFNKSDSDSQHDGSKRSSEWQLIADVKGLFNICFPKPMEGITPSVLQEQFSPYGTISDLSISDSKVYIRYKEKEAAESAKAALGDRYGIFYPRVKRPTAGAEVALKPEVFLANIHLETTEDEVRELFQNYTVKSLYLYTRPGQGYAFITLDSLDSAVSAARDVNGTRVRGHDLVARFNHISSTRGRSRSRGYYPGYQMRSRSSSPPRPGYYGMRPRDGLQNIPDGIPVDVFICNFPLEETEDELKILFRNYNTLSIFRLKPSAKYKDTGAALVKVADMVTAGCAIKELNGFMYKGRKLTARLSNGQFGPPQPPPGPAGDFYHPQMRNPGRPLLNGYGDPFWAHRSGYGRPPHADHRRDIPMSATAAVTGGSKPQMASYLVGRVTNMMTDLLDDCPTCIRINNLLGELQQVVDSIAQDERRKLKD